MVKNKDQKIKKIIFHETTFLAAKMGFSNVTRVVAMIMGDFYSPTGARDRAEDD